ncbi:hypothetical protein SAMN04487930_10885 [Cytophaga hutchinsonii ATCC 33406]|nr:hypothetical protein SAMN04487930_10885 [Cytophaga hutchinsonii ATCC 33406]
MEFVLRKAIHFSLLPNVSFINSRFRCVDFSDLYAWKDEKGLIKHFGLKKIMEIFF